MQKNLASYSSSAEAAVSALFSKPNQTLVLIGPIARSRCIILALHLQLKRNAFRGTELQAQFLSFVGCPHAQHRFDASVLTLDEG